MGCADHAWYVIYDLCSRDAACRSLGPVTSLVLEAEGGVFSGITLLQQFQEPRAVKLGLGCAGWRGLGKLGGARDQSRLSLLAEKTWLGWGA